MAGVAFVLFLAYRFLPFPSPALEVAGRFLLGFTFPFAILAQGAPDRADPAILTRLLRGGASAQEAEPIHQ